MFIGVCPLLILPGIVQFWWSFCSFRVSIQLCISALCLVQSNLSDIPRKSRLVLHIKYVRSGAPLPRISRLHYCRCGRQHQQGHLLSFTSPTYICNWFSRLLNRIALSVVMLVPRSLSRSEPRVGRDAKQSCSSVYFLCTLTFWLALLRFNRPHFTVWFDLHDEEEEYCWPGQAIRLDWSRY